MIDFYNVMRKTKTMIEDVSSNLVDVVGTYSYQQMRFNYLIECIKGKAKICSLCVCNEDCRNEDYNLCRTCENFSLDTEGILNDIY